MKTKSIVLFFAILFLIIFMADSLRQNACAQYQYSQAEINLAIIRLKERGLLETFVNKTADDPKQFAIRADILIAAYHIIREIDQLKSKGLSATAPDIEQLQSTVRNLSQRLTAMDKAANVNINETALMNNVITNLNTYLKENPTIIGLQSSLHSLENEDATFNDRLTSIENQLEEFSSGADNNMDKNIRNSKIMSATSLLITLTVSILAAR